MTNLDRRGFLATALASLGLAATTKPAIRRPLHKRPQPEPTASTFIIIFLRRPGLPRSRGARC